MKPEVILILLITFVVFEFLFDEILSWLNVKNQKAKVPPELSGLYDDDAYEKSKAYHLTNFRFGLFRASLSVILTIIVIKTGLLGSLSDKVASWFESKTAASLVFFGIIYIAMDLLSIPFSLYHTFVIEEKFGFNKSTYKVFFADKLKGYLLAILFGGIILSVFLLLVESLGPSFWFVFWIVISLIMVFINLFYTSLIVPLFNKLKPLDESELRSAIEDYSRKVDFPLTNVFVIDGSKRSSKTNAYFAGLGKRKKIVLFDTLIQKHTIQELVAVLAHEAGHFKKKHIITGMIISILNTGLILFILSRFLFTPELSSALGSTQHSVPLNLIAFGMLFTPLSHITGILMNIFSRKNEFEADEYAAKTYSAQPLIDALKKLSVDNLSNLTPHPVYVFVNYSHPPLIERLRALEKLK